MYVRSKTKLYTLWLDPWHRYYKNRFDLIELKVPFSVFHLRICRKFTLTLFLHWQLDMYMQKIAICWRKIPEGKILLEKNSTAHPFK